MEPGSSKTTKKSSRSARFSWIAWSVTVSVLVVAAFGTLPLAMAQGWLVSGGEPTISSAELEKLQPGAGRAGLAGYPNFDEALPSSPEAIRAALAQLPKSDGVVGAAAGDLSGDAITYSSDADRPLVPASTMKVMTSLGALSKLGADHRFSTDVTLAGDVLTLVGHGDPLLAATSDSHPYAKYLSMPSLQQLAQQSAAALKQKSISSVQLRFDDSYFAAPSWHPDWYEDYIQFVSPVTALAVDLGKPKEHADQADPSTAAALIFADQLRASGIEVTGDVTRQAAAEGAENLTSVASVPMFNVLERLNVHSDNYIAEVLFRHIALASGQPATFDGGAAAQTANLQELGLWSEGQAIRDGSGLSEHNRLTAENLVKAMQLAQRDDRFRVLLETLPAAASTGTMAVRFHDEQSSAARGILRAKTGRLSDVSSMVGYAPTPDGSLIAFAAIGNEMPTDKSPTPWFDHFASALSACKCAQK